MTAARDFFLKSRPQTLLLARSKRWRDLNCDGSLAENTNECKLRRRVLARLMPVHTIEQPNAGDRKYEVAQPNRLRRKSAILCVIDAYSKQWVIHQQNRQEANEKASDE